MVHRVDTTSSKYRHLPPTAIQLARLAKSSRASKPDAESCVDHEFVIRNLRRRLGPKEIEELVVRYNAGEHTPALAREYEVSTTGLRQLLLKEGVEFRMQSITPEDSDRAVKLYENGLTIREVATGIEHAFGAIRRELRRRGVPMWLSGRWNHSLSGNLGLITDCRLRKRRKGKIPSWLNGNRSCITKAYSGKVTLTGSKTMARSLCWQIRFSLDDFPTVSERIRDEREVLRIIPEQDFTFIIRENIEEIWMKFPEIITG